MKSNCPVLTITENYLSNFQRIIFILHFRTYFNTNFSSLKVMKKCIYFAGYSSVGPNCQN